MRNRSAKISMLNWDDLRLFLAASRDRSFVAAGRRMQIDQTTVARRLAALEATIGSSLFHRSPRGITLTEAGVSLVIHAEKIEAEVMVASARLEEREGEITGTVRLATPEAFGTFLVAPNATTLHTRHPDLQLELVPESRAVSLSLREADLAVVLNRPPRGRLVARKLTDYRLGLYGAGDYIAAHPAIDDLNAARAHPFVWYIDEMIDIPELRYFDQIVAGSATAFRSSSIAAQHEAVANGLGLGILHAFAADADRRLVRVLPQTVQVARSYWLVVHKEQQRLPRVRAVIDFIIDVVTRNRRRF
jgi:DNA-binding transcriptional LysR family regulator